MSDEFFVAFEREIPIGLSRNSIRELAEEISYAKRMDLVEVEQELLNKQTEASTKWNEQRKYDRSRGYKFFS